DLTFTKVTDGGLKKLSALASLTKLALGGSLVTDAGMKTLVEALPRLEGLHLAGSPIGDSGLKELEKLKKLTKLYLRDTKVSDAGVAAFRKALPKCVIER